MEPDGSIVNWQSSISNVVTSRPLHQLDSPPSGVPAWLPLAWLGCAMIWLAAGSVGLVLVSPELAAGNFFSPRVFAVTHAFTLGVLFSAIVGALHQFIPVVLGVPIRHPRVAIWAFWLSQAGTGLLVYGLWNWRPSWQAVAWLVLFASVGAASWTVLPARRRATQNRVVGGFVSLGHSALGVAMLIALARIGQGLGWWQVPRNGLLVAHLHLGLVGFGSMTAVGMASKMLPAFLKSAADPEPSRLHRIGWLAAAGLLLLATGSLANLSPAIVSGGAITLIAVGLHLMVLVGYWRRRSIAKLDPALGFIGWGILWYAVAAALGGVILLRRPSGGGVWIAYALAGILGWLIHLIVGVLHRIGPRLLANLRAGRGRPLTPSLARAELPWPRLAWASLAAISTGTAVLAVGVIPGASVAARVGAGLILTGTIGLLIQAIALGKTAIDD